MNHLEKIIEEFARRFIIKYKSGHCDDCKSDKFGEYVSTGINPEDIRQSFKEAFHAGLDAAVERLEKQKSETNKWPMVSESGVEHRFNQGYSDALSQAIEIIQSLKK